MNGKERQRERREDLTGVCTTTDEAFCYAKFTAGTGSGGITFYSGLCLSTGQARRCYDRLVLLHGHRSSRLLYTSKPSALHLRALRAVRPDPGRPHPPKRFQLAYGLLADWIIDLFPLLLLLALLPALSLAMPSSSRALLTRLTSPSLTHPSSRSRFQSAPSSPLAHLPCYSPRKMSMPPIKRALQLSDASSLESDDNSANFYALCDLLDGSFGAVTEFGSTGATIAIARPQEDTHWSDSSIDALVQRWLPECQSQSCIRAVDVSRSLDSKVTLKESIFGQVRQCPKGVLVVHGASQLRPNMTEPIRQVASEDGSFTRGSEQVDSTHCMRVLDFVLPIESLQRHSSTHDALRDHIQSLGNTNEDARAADALSRRIHATFALFGKE